MSTKFNSEGFDLDALPSGSPDENVVYEVGGNVTVEKPASSDHDQAGSGEETPISRSEQLKAQGNEQFKEQNYLEAYDLYTAAIEACPGMTGDELLQMRDEFDEKEREKLYERNRLDSEARRRRRAPGEAAAGKSETADDSEASTQPPKPEVFEAPSHPYGDKLAIYHSNRAACKLHLNSFDDAMKDCDVAILLNPRYAKAYLRRSMAYEKTERTDQALSDAKKALELEPNNGTVAKTVARLQKIEDERLEKLKEETMGKLKDLGNSLLGNFGLSLDNFKTVQDPNTGSYSIQFEQSKK